MSPADWTHTGLCVRRQKIETNYQSWLEKTVAQEVSDWRRDVPPDTDGDLFQTAAPLIVFQMIDQKRRAGGSAKAKA